MNIRQSQKTGYIASARRCPEIEEKLYCAKTLTKPLAPPLIIFVMTIGKSGNGKKNEKKNATFAAIAKQHGCQCTRYGL
jgi:hypothetical protein